MGQHLSRSFRFRFIALILLALLPALALSFYSVTKQRHDSIERAQQEVTRITQLAADNYDNLVTSTHQLLITLANQPIILSDDPDVCTGLFDELLGRYPVYSGFAIIKVNGDVLCPPSESGELINVSDREYFQQVMETGEFTIGKYVQSRLSGRRIVVLTYPVLDENEDIIRVVAASLTVNWLSNIAREADLPQDGVLFMVQSDGTLLARYPELDPERAQNESAAPVIQTLIRETEEASTLDTVGLDGVERLYSYTQLAGTEDARDAYLVVGFSKDRVVAPANHQLGLYLLALGLAALLGVGSVWFGGEIFIMHPLEAVLDASKRLSAGDLSTRVEHNGGPVELTRLADAFNTMASQLERRDEERRQDEAEIRRLNSELELRVMERTSQLESINRELEAFTYSVSHDLRAPLRAIDGFSRIVVTEYTQQIPEEAQRYLGRVRDAAQRMGQLIDDLLAFSRLGRQPMVTKEVEPANLVTQVLDDLSSEWQNRDVEIIVGELPAAYADPALLRQVYFNLLSNAVKFTKNHEHARIEVGAQQTDEVVYFVKDNGAGFDMRYADKLFGVFQRLHRVEDFEGTGVGLATVQRIIHRHKGKIWAEAAVDSGATFYFTLGDVHNERTSSQDPAD